MKHKITEINKMKIDFCKLFGVKMGQEFSYHDSYGNCIFPRLKIDIDGELVYWEQAYSQWYSAKFDLNQLLEGYIIKTPTLNQEILMEIEECPSINMNFLYKKDFLSKKGEDIYLTLEAKNINVENKALYKTGVWLDRIDLEAQIRKEFDSEKGNENFEKLIQDEMSKYTFYKFMDVYLEDYKI